jgi:hypothetical protein
MRRFALALSALLVSCGVEVAQTAVLDTSTAQAPDCGTAATLVLPTNPAFRATDVVASSDLVLTSYGAQAGPGIYVDARRLSVVFERRADRSKHRCARPELHSRHAFAG